MTTPALPPAMLQLLRKAQGELARGQIDAAAATVAGVLAQTPDCVPALGMAGAAAQLRGRPGEAIDWFRKALAIRPQDAPLHAGLGIALFESGDAEGAIAALQRACELAPGVAANWYNLGKAFKARLRTEDAIQALGHALRLDPTHVSARLTLADAKASIGGIDAAANDLRAILKAHPGQARAWFALANLKVVPFTGEDIVVLRSGFEAASTTEEDRVLFGFALARGLEDQGDVAGSFDVLTRANRLQRNRVRWSATANRRQIGAIEHAFATRRPESLDPTLGREVIIIASIPRSGSSLVEQILASHPDVTGANEITDLPRILEVETRQRGRAYPDWIADATPADWHRLGQAYLLRTARWRALTPRFTDKNLANWKHLGAALAMLPAAHVVVVHRDPLETCLACYRQWFASGTEFAYDLNELADYWADFARLTRFWGRQYPDRVFDLEYESMLADPAAVVRRLLDFCGLPFDPKCLAFHQTRRTVISAASAAQVRQPLHATARAARYGHLLDGLRQRLQDEAEWVADR